MISRLEEMVKEMKKGTPIRVKKGVVKFLNGSVGEVIKAENINCVYVNIDGTQYKLYAEDLEIIEVKVEKEEVKETLTVEEVKAYATEKYEEGGDCIIEAYEDEYILELIDEGYTLKDFKEIMDNHKERWNRHRNNW